jgi:tRNA(adenine34) deaminase
MCCGAIIQARVSRLVYAASDPKFGGVESLYSILSDPRSNHRVEVKKVELEEASTVLKDFFKALR